MSKPPKGFSVQLNGGTKYAGFYARLSNMSFRICLGYLAFNIMFYDVEPAMSNLVKSLAKKEPTHE